MTSPFSMCAAMSSHSILSLLATLVYFPIVPTLFLQPFSQVHQLGDTWIHAYFSFQHVLLTWTSSSPPILLSDHEISDVAIWLWKQVTFFFQIFLRVYRLFSASFRSNTFLLPPVFTIFLRRLYSIHLSIRWLILHKNSADISLFVPRCSYFLVLSLTSGMHQVLLLWIFYFPDFIFHHL